MLPDQQVEKKAFLTLAAFTVAMVVSVKFPLYGLGLVFEKFDAPEPVGNIVK